MHPSTLSQTSPQNPSARLTSRRLTVRLSRKRSAVGLQAVVRRYLLDWWATLCFGLPTLLPDTERRSADNPPVPARPPYMNHLISIPFTAGRTPRSKLSGVVDAAKTGNRN
jgi:hypothetical protein